jgi:hypothetical protein
MVRQIHSSSSQFNQNYHDLGVNLRIDINTYGQNKSELIYTRQFEAPPKSHNTFAVYGLDQEFLSYAVFQLHCFYYNVTLGLERDSLEQIFKNGTNIGFVLEQTKKPKTTFSLWNDNYDNVQCMLAMTIYNKSAPIIGGCNSIKDPNLLLHEIENFIVLQTPLASESNTKCDNNSSIKYFTYFVYLEQLNFNSDVYFDGIRSLLFKNAFRNGFEVRKMF